VATLTQRLIRKERSSRGAEAEHETADFLQGADKEVLAEKRLLVTILGVFRIEIWKERQRIEHRQPARHV